jgi:hypothetical protein
MVYFSTTFTTLTCHQTFRLQDSGGLALRLTFLATLIPLSLSLCDAPLFSRGFAVMLPYGRKKGGLKRIPIFLSSYYSCANSCWLFFCEVARIQQFEPT